MARAGIEAVAAPVLELVERGVDAHSLIGDVRRGELLVFLSASAVHSVAESAKRLNALSDLLDAVRRVSVAVAEGGKGVAAVRGVLGVEPMHWAESPSELLEQVRGRVWRGCVVVHGGERDQHFVAVLGDTCGWVSEYQPYEAVVNNDAVRLVAQLDADVYVFTSVSAVRAVASLPEALDRVRRGVAVVPGEALARELEALGVRAVVARGRIPGIVSTILGLAGATRSSRP